MAGVRKDDLTAQEFNNWVVVEYIGKSKYLCKCKECGTGRKFSGYFLKTGQIPKCECETGRSAKGRIDLTGKHFGTWEVIDYAGDKHWRCRCLCDACKGSTIRIVAGGDLRNGKSTSCGASTNRNIDNLTGKQFGDWVVQYKASIGPSKETMWHCKCSCGAETDISAYSLKSGNSRSCGHSTTGFKDLTGEIFGNWLVLGLSTKSKSSETIWTCECQCDNHTIQDISSYNIRNGISKSCRCLTQQLRKETCKMKYGVVHPSQRGTTRTAEQLDMVISRENLLKAIKDNFDYKPKPSELGVILGLDRTSTLIHIKKQDLLDYVNINKSVSQYKNELNNLFPCNNRSDRKEIQGKELDLYYPDKRFAIEFNGTYWHCEINKDKLYHQNKSLLGAKNNIHIFHIFEYEWKNAEMHDKIVHYIETILKSESNEIVYARNCKVTEISKEKANEFINKYHFQGKSSAKINIALTYNSKIIGVMTFGKSRFDKKYQYELIRLCWAYNVACVGGSEKIFKYFIKNYNPDNIVSYCDISKFNGRVYNKLGFKLKEVTQPNYKWVDIENNRVIPRYQAQKHKLLANGLGTEDQTEAEIMHNIEYTRIYDSGNYKFIWTKRLEVKEEQ